MSEVVAPAIYVIYSHLDSQAGRTRKLTINEMQFHFQNSMITYNRQEGAIALYIIYSLPAITRKITFDVFVLLMLGIHAKYVPWTMTNITRVDAKREFSI